MPQGTPKGFVVLEPVSSYREPDSKLLTYKLGFTSVPEISQISLTPIGRTG